MAWATHSMRVLFHGAIKPGLHFTLLWRILIAGTSGDDGWTEDGLREINAASPGAERT